MTTCCIEQAGCECCADEEQQAVWICESGDYEQRSVWGVFSSPEAGIEGIKRLYGEPYVVRWEQGQDGDEWFLNGDFEEVPGFSTKHIGYFDFRPMTLDELPR